MDEETRDEQTRDERSVVRDEGVVPAASDDDKRRASDDAPGESGQPLSPDGGGSTNRYTGSQGESYADEVQAEHEGTTPTEVKEENAEPGGKANRW